MPDDPAAILYLGKTVGQLRKVFARARGLSWGDALPHHPAQVPGMSFADIEALHERPVHLPADSLTWEESNYFFSHAGYTGNPQKDLKPAVKYFLPRYAEFFSHPTPQYNVGITTDIRIFGERLGLVSWTTWPDLESTAVADWLEAWGLASIRFHPAPSDDSWPLCWGEAPAHRDVADVLYCLCASGLDLKSLIAPMQSISIEQTLRVATGLMSCNQKRTRKGQLFDLPKARIGADRPLIDWLISTRTREILEQGVFTSVLPNTCSTMISVLEGFTESVQRRHGS